MKNLQTYFFLLEAEQMPEDADDDWFLPQPEPNIRTTETLQIFETHVKGLIDDLQHLTTEEDFQTAFYNRAKLAFGEDKASIRTFFQLLYLLIFQRPQGPRWGQFVTLIGKDEFCARLSQRINSPLSW
jgi:lysyl-tRNA synthetase class I